MCYWFNSNNHPLLSSEANAGFASLIPESGRSPGEGNGNLLLYSCLRNSHGPKSGQKSLVGYSPWARKRVGHDLVTDYTKTLNSECLFSSELSRSK